MKIHSEVPGWRYWFDKSRKVWIGERGSRRVTCANQIRLVVGMLTGEELPDCVYEQIKPSLSDEQLDLLSERLRDLVDRAVVLGDEWDRDDSKWSAYSDAQAEIYEFVKSNVNEIACCIIAGKGKQGVP